MVLHRHLCIVFLPNAPRGIFELPYCSSCGWLTVLKRCYLVSWVKIQYARDDEGPYFCINENKNTDNDLYCSSNKFPNHLALLPMVRPLLQVAACV